MRTGIGKMKLISLLTMVLVTLLSGCKSPMSTTTSATTGTKNTTTTITTTTTTTTTTTFTTVTTSSYSQYQLEYLLFAQYTNVFYCDPDYYPVAREGQEQQNAISQFPAIQSNQAEFSAILKYLNLPDKTEYTDNEKLLIYREYKKLTYGVQMTAADGGYSFDLRVGEGQGERIQGTIKTSGEIQETSREPSINTCPICLVKGTLIDTPQGQIPVEQLVKGLAIWTMDAAGNRIAGKIIETASTIVPTSFHVLRIELNDGRNVTASPGHPTADGKAIVDYQVGDILDGAVVIAVTDITYENGVTYDILPDSATGVYWANGILLGSTLKK